MKFIRSLIDRWIFGRINEFQKHLDQTISAAKSSDQQNGPCNSWTSLFTRYRYRLSQTIVKDSPLPSQNVHVALPPQSKIELPQDRRLVLRALAVGRFYNPDQKILGQYKKGDRITLMVVLDNLIEINLEIIWLCLGKNRYLPTRDFDAIRIVKVLPRHNDTIEWGQELCVIEIVQPEIDNKT
ncbi:MAG: hypothetical protein V1853_01695 [bacterium]